MAENNEVMRNLLRELEFHTEPSHEHCIEKLEHDAILAELDTKIDVQVERIDRFNKKCDVILMDISSSLEKIIT